MRIEPTPLPGLMLVRQDRRTDERGFFARTWCAKAFAAAGVDFAPTQMSVSFSERSGTLRGLHWQSEPHAETKLVRVTRGAVFDVAVDLRPGSPTRGRWHGVRLDAEAGDAFLIPKGFAHGLLTLSDATEVLYAMDTPYEAAAARRTLGRPGLRDPLARRARRHRAEGCGLAGLGRRGVTARVLVTGASGFVGRQTLAPLLAAGVEVHVAGRRDPGVPGVRFHAADLLDPAAPAAIMPSVAPSHVLHCAWAVEHGVFWRSPLNLDWSAATLALLHAAADAGASRFVGVGTCVEYDWSDGGAADRRETDRLAPRRSTAPPRPRPFATAASFAPRHGLSFAWGRLFHLFGPGEDERRLVSLGAGRAPGRTVGRARLGPAGAGFSLDHRCRRGPRRARALSRGRPGQRGQRGADDHRRSRARDRHDRRPAEPAAPRRTARSAGRNTAHGGGRDAPRPRGRLPPGDDASGAVGRALARTLSAVAPASGHPRCNLPKAPPDNEAAVMTVTAERIVTIVPPGRPLTGRVMPPGSKSITNRVLLLAALAAGTSRLTGALKSDDTLYMAEALRAMGVTVEEPDATTFVVTGDGRLKRPAAPLFLGNAGTATRFLTAACCLVDGEVVVDGDAHMRKRPIAPLVEALRALALRSMRRRAARP